jgi:hypothetical protein
MVARPQFWFNFKNEAVADFYIVTHRRMACPIGHRGAGLAKLDNYLDRPADPFNEHEPVDSSAAAIAWQGLLRLATSTADR